MACHKCGKEYVSSEGANRIIFCPFCHHSDVVDLDYFGSDDPCMIYLGAEVIGKVIKDGSTYHLISEKFGLDEDLSYDYLSSAFSAGERISALLDG